MTREEAAHYMIRGIIADLPEDEIKQTEECKQKLTSIMEEYGDQGILALSLLGAELAVRAEKEKW